MQEIQIWLGFFSLIFKKVLRMFSCRETLQHKLGSFRNIVSSYLLGGSSFSSLPFSDSFPQSPHFHKWGRMGNLMLLGNRVRMCNYGLPNNFFACVFDVHDPWCLRAAHFPVPCFGMYWVLSAPLHHCGLHIQSTLFSTLSCLFLVRIVLSTTGRKVEVPGSISKLMFNHIWILEKLLFREEVCLN